MKCLDAINKIKGYNRILHTKRLQNLWENVIMTGIKDKDLRYLESEDFKLHCKLANLDYEYLLEIIDANL